MRLFNKMKALISNHYCSKCGNKMSIEKINLYQLPILVGHYVSHEDVAYYLKNMVKVQKKAEIPTGYYACGSYRHICDNCGYKYVRLTIFLPVREQEKFEENIYFMNGELDEFLKK